MKQNSHRIIFNMVWLLMFFSSCQKEKSENATQANQPLEVQQKHAENGFAENDMVMYWNDKTATVLGAAMRQPDRARYFAIIQIAVHDALNNIKPKFQRFALLDERTKFASYNAAVASAAYWAIKGLNRQGNFPVDTWYNESLAQIPDGAAKESGKLLGKHAAEAIIANRATDGFSQVLATSVNPPDGTIPGAYRHTNLLNVRYIPNWGTVVLPMVITSNSQFRPQGYNALSSAAYAADYNETKQKGARTGSTRSAEEESLAKFWAENRPSLLWNNFARQIVASKKMDAWKTARLFALIHTAMFDGINSVMEAKYHFYSWRPETAIHEASTDGNSETSADISWLPFLIEAPSSIPAANFVTPPVPEYPSSYAMYGGAVAQILQYLMGTDEIDIDLTSFSLPGATLHYTSIAQAARDNSLAKIYAGWYFRKAVLDGEEQGKQVATYIVNHQFLENDDED